VTEEIWSWWHAEGSIHVTSWPTPSAIEGDPAIWSAASEVLRSIRRVKSEAGKSMRASVAVVTVTDAAPRLAILGAVADDLREAGSVASLVLDLASAGDEGRLEVELAED
jgi:valyl-tRNA synthetase